MGKVISCVGLATSLVLMIVGGLAFIGAILGAVCIPFWDAYYLLAENVWPSALRMVWDGFVLGLYALASGYIGFGAITGDSKSHEW